MGNRTLIIALFVVAGAFGLWLGSKRSTEVTVEMRRTHRGKASAALGGTDLSSDPSQGSSAQPQLAPLNSAALPAKKLPILESGRDQENSGSTALDWEILQAMGTIWEQNISKAGITPQAKRKTVEDFKKLPGVKTAILDDDEEGIAVFLKSGMKHYFETRERPNNPENDID